jgi:excinuclease ABC subunit A
VYIGAFEEIRDLFAQSEPAKQRGLNSSAFSFNSGQGQCERCRGAGFEKIEMQFLSDIFIRCADCDGRRYRAHILEVKISPPSPPSSQNGSTGRRSSRGQNPAAARALSIGDLLESTVEEAIAFLSAFVDSRPALRALRSLRLLEEVGLGYLKLGQPINTLSGGESQRLKLVRHLAEVDAAQPASDLPEPEIQPADAGREVQKLTRYRLSSTRPVQSRQGVAASKPLLFLFDEPTTGLHFDDVRRLLKVFHRLVDAGHSVLVIEHNVDVVKSADWIIDLGPEAGDRGGQIVAEGTPEHVATCATSHTGQVLKEVLELTGQPVPARCE